MVFVGEGRGALWELGERAATGGSFRGTFGGEKGVFIFVVVICLLSCDVGEVRGFVVCCGACAVFPCVVSCCGDIWTWLVEK